MDIQNKTVLILGGFGLVGSAVARKLVPENPGKIIITSLFKAEAEEAVLKFEEEFKEKHHYIEGLVKGKQGSSEVM